MRAGRARTHLRPFGLKAYVSSPHPFADPVRRAAPPEAGADAAALLAELDSALAVAAHARQSLSEVRARAALHTALARVSDRIEDLEPTGRPDPHTLEQLMADLTGDTSLRSLGLETVAWICEARATVLDDLLHLDSEGEER